MTNRHQPDARLTDVTRRQFLQTATAGVGVAASAGSLAASAAVAATPQTISGPRRRQGGLLLPQRNDVRDVIDLSGLWQFQLDPQDEGEAGRWYDRLPSPRPIAVPCSWNELFDDARDYLGSASSSSTRFPRSVSASPTATT